MNLNESSENVEHHYDHLEQMVYDGCGYQGDGSQNLLNEDLNQDAQRMFKMIESASRPLYEGCDVTQLAAATELLNIKAEFHIPERGYNSISQWFHRCAPANNTLPQSLYDTKKLVEGLGLPVEKIDCCPNGCMIYWGDDASLHMCKMCNHLRFK